MVDPSMPMPMSASVTGHKHTRRTDDEDVPTQTPRKSGGGDQDLVLALKRTVASVMTQSADAKATAQAAKQRADGATSAAEAGRAVAEEARALAGKAVKAVDVAIQSADAARALAEEVKASVIAAPDRTSRRLVVVITSTSIGHADGALGSRLMHEMLGSMLGAQRAPWRLILLNAGVRLATLDPTAVQALQAMQQAGTDVLSGASSLEHFGLADRLGVGRIVTMDEVLDSIAAADWVITLQ
jgi:hypothetical protein